MSSTNRGAKRHEADFYPTPASAFLPLLPLLSEDSTYYDPCCGDGRLIVWMRSRKLLADGADLFPQTGWPCPRVDFLQDTEARDFIITNPPFSMAQEFCDHALTHASEVLMLLRLNFLGAQKRRDWWKANEPDALFVLSERPDFTGGGGDSCDYAWFYWGNRWKGVHHL